MLPIAAMNLGYKPKDGLVWDDTYTDNSAISLNGFDANLIGTNNITNEIGYKIFKKPVQRVEYREPKLQNKSKTNTNKKPVQSVELKKSEPIMVKPTLKVDVKPRMVQGTMEQDVKPKYWESEYSASYGNPNIGKGRINYGNGKVQEYAMGGPINTMYAGGGSMYNMPTKGLTHEQHPWGGYPIGGNNYVEGGEVILDKPDGGKYIFSNRLSYK
jgi:hypothetical protein